MSRIDHHAAVLSLRGKYALCRKLLAGEGGDLESLDSLQAALESLSPRTLSLGPVQGLMVAAMRRFRGSECYKTLSSAVLVYFYGRGVTLLEQLSAELFEYELHTPV